MPCLADIASPIPPAGRDVLGGEIYQRFQNDPETLAIAIIDDEARPVGLIERNAFLVQMGAQHGYALWAKRLAVNLMKTNPMVLEANVPVAELYSGLPEGSLPDLLNGFVVVQDGRYLGVGTTLDLLRHTAAATAEHAAEMTRMAWHAGEALAAKERFLAVMSHEIRTPLNGVLAVAEILRRKSRQTDLDPFIDTIINSGGVLLRLLNDALDLSRADAAELNLDEAPFQVGQLMDDALRLWGPKAELAGVALVATLSGRRETWVRGDRVRLSQILNNLIGNALKFTAAGSVQLMLELDDSGDAPRLRCEVIDTGPGIADEFMQSVFLPFRQTDTGARVGGAGLGLAVCKRIIERMGGSISARANPEGGTVFAFDAPLQVLPDQAFAPDAGDAQAPDRPIHVLVADDNETNRLVASTLCELFGFSVERVTDGDDAVAVCQSRRFDLILMDIMMPRMDGVEATRRIRASAGPASHTPIVALTANADPADADFYRRAGINGVVEKPLKPELLMAAINAVLHVPEAAAEVAA